MLNQSFGEDNNNKHWNEDAKNNGEGPQSELLNAFMLVLWGMKIESSRAKDYDTLSDGI
jgi:hypothetical protein